MYCLVVDVRMKYYRGLEY